MMDFLSFCESIESTLVISENRIISFFVSEDQEVYLFALCKKILLKHYLPVFEIKYLESGALEKTCAELASMFLGEKKLYWIFGFSSLSLKDQQLFITYLKNFDCPHRLCIMHTQKNISLGLTVTVNNEFTCEEAVRLMTILTNHKQASVGYFFDFFKHNNIKITLATIHVLFDYITVVGINSKEFFVEWLPQIFVASQSLFKVSQFFFAKDMRNFLIMWKDVSGTYPMSFWCTFFSEQLFKAMLFICVQKKGEQSNSEIESRLPFSFLKKDWKMHTLENLVSAHEWISLFDSRLKKGEARDEELELFCIQFMQK